MIAAEVGLVELLVGLPTAAVAAFGVYLAYKRGTKADAVAEQAGIATKDERSVGQVFDGLNSIINNLQKDNETVRARVEIIEARLATVEEGNTDLLGRNLALERENVALHAEIEELRVENQKLKARIVELEKVKGD